jgi:hypothetical protein
VARQDGWEPFLLQSFLSRDGVMRCLGGDLAGYADGFGRRRLGNVRAGLPCNLWTP